MLHKYFKHIVPGYGIFHNHMIVEDENHFFEYYMKIRDMRGGTIEIIDHDTFISHPNHKDVLPWDKDYFEYKMDQYPVEFENQEQMEQYTVHCWHLNIVKK